MKEAAVGIDIGGTHIKTGVVTRDGAVLLRRTVPTEAAMGPEALIEKVKRIIADAKSECARQGYQLSGVGIGTAGQVNAGSGTVAGATSSLPGWGGIPLAERIREETALDTVVDNDVNAIALGEAWWGAGREWNHFVCVAVGTGIGGCLIMDRKIYHGRDGYAGEFGQQIIAIHEGAGLVEGYGRWENYASVTALKRLIAERSSDAELTDPRYLFSEADAGNPAAIKIIDEYIGYLAAGLANLIHVFNPPAIVVGGAITLQRERLFQPLRTKVAKLVLPAFIQNGEVCIIPAELGEDAGVVGAAGRYFMEAERLSK